MNKERLLSFHEVRHIQKPKYPWFDTVEELEDLNRMHPVYHDSDKLNGNGFLKELMNTVNTTLEIRVK